MYSQAFGQLDTLRSPTNATYYVRLQHDGCGCTRRDGDTGQARNTIEHGDAPQDNQPDESKAEQPEGCPLDPAEEVVAPHHCRYTKDKADEGAAAVRAECRVDENRDRDEDEHQQAEALPGVIEELVAKVLVPCQLVASSAREDDGQDVAKNTTYHGSSFPKGKVSKLGNFPSKAISPWKEQQADN